MTVHHLHLRSLEAGLATVPLDQRRRRPPGTARPRESRRFAGSVTAVAVDVVPYSPAWPLRFQEVAGDLRCALEGVPSARIEHVGSTAVPGLAAKPILDIDIIVDSQDTHAAVTALEAVGYVHRGDLGVADREAFAAPDEDPRRHVYVCRAGTLHVRNHLAVRDALRARADLRDEYGAVKLALAADPIMTMDAYVAGKSAVLQKVLDISGLTDEERLRILRLNDPTA